MWEKTLLWSYDGGPLTPSLPDLCRRLFAEQVATWEAMRRAYEALDTARRREISCDGGLSWQIQLNPGRVTSAEAKVDAASIAHRPCFLCPEHLPQEQKAILYRRTFGILCNPFPIFAPHFTVAHLGHRPQNLEENLPALLQLARDLSPDFSVFYNGPRCGASAPDHLHFQACPAGIIPVEKIHIPAIGSRIQTEDEVSLFDFRRFGRHFFFLAGDIPDALCSVMKRILGALRQIMGEREEAMVNVMVSFRAGNWHIFIFPRRKHRPDAFSRTGEDRRAITPGAVEMGGLVVTTNERDFTKLDTEELIAIFTEVSVDDAIMDGVAHALFSDHG